MDDTLEKEIAVTKLKAAALNHRSQAMLAVAELVNEYTQLAMIQQRQIEALKTILKAYEDKSVEPIPVSVPAETPMPAD